MHRTSLTRVAAAASLVIVAALAPALPAAAEPGAGGAQVTKVEAAPAPLVEAAPANPPAAPPADPAVPADPAAPADPAVRDGRSAHGALASCWDIKQTDPSAPDGRYWLYTPALGVPQQFYCDMTTDGGGWVLIGRGREGWAFLHEGQGSTAEVSATVSGSAAFAPKHLDADTVDGLLGWAGRPGPGRRAAGPSRGERRRDDVAGGPPLAEPLRRLELGPQRRLPAGRRAVRHHQGQRRHHRAGRGGHRPGLPQHLQAGARTTTCPASPTARP